MAALKISMDTRHKSTDGGYPVIIQLSNKTKSTIIPTNIKLLSSAWDGTKAKVTRAHPNFEELNHALKQQLLKLEVKLLQLSVQAQEMNVSALKPLMLNTSSTGAVSFLAFANNEIQQLKDQERFGNTNAYKAAVSRFVTFAGKDILLDQNHLYSHF